MDVTGDGAADTVKLLVLGESVTSPFHWILSIESQGKEVFSYKGDGTWFDAFFKDEGYVADCDGYVACKEKFFYRDILNRFVVPPSGYLVDAFVDESASNSLYGLGIPSLKKCCNVEGDEARAILSAMAERLKSGRAVVIQNFTSPQTLDPEAAMFVPEVGRFLPIYAP